MAFVIYSFRQLVVVIVVFYYMQMSPATAIFVVAYACI